MWVTSRALLHSVQTSEDLLLAQSSRAQRVGGAPGLVALMMPARKFASLVSAAPVSANMRATSSDSLFARYPQQHEEIIALVAKAKAFQQRNTKSGQLPAEVEKAAPITAKDENGGGSVLDTLDLRRIEAAVDGVKARELVRHEQERQHDELQRRAAAQLRKMLDESPTLQRMAASEPPPPTGATTAALPPDAPASHEEATSPPAIAGGGGGASALKEIARLYRALDRGHREALAGEVSAGLAAVSAARAIGGGNGRPRGGGGGGHRRRLDGAFSRYLQNVKVPPPRARVATGRHGVAFGSATGTERHPEGVRWAAAAAGDAPRQSRKSVWTGDARQGAPPPPPPPSPPPPPPPPHAADRRRAARRVAEARARQERGLTGRERRDRALRQRRERSSPPGRRPNRPRCVSPPRPDWRAANALVRANNDRHRAANERMARAALSAAATAAAAAATAAVVSPPAREHRPPRTFSGYGASFEHIPAVDWVAAANRGGGAGTLPTRPPGDDGPLPLPPPPPPPVEFGHAAGGGTADDSLPSVDEISSALLAAAAAEAGDRPAAGGKAKAGGRGKANGAGH